MEFLSLHFTLLLLGLLAVHWAVPRRSVQNGALFLASLVFVGAAGASPLFLFLASTVLEWLLCRAMVAATSRRTRSTLLWTSVALNVAQIAFFKYSSFYIPEAIRLLAAFGLEPGIVHLVMPAGLSFWTLQKMTLTLDAYYGRLKAAPSLLRAFLFTGFFPTFLSGPIERARTLLPQFDQARRLDARRLSEATWLIAIGAFQKAVIADNVGECVDQLLGPEASGVGIVIGLWAYAIQIYCDFAGYSDMARGVARLLGLDITQNFLAPYFSPNLSDYWKRWHVSFSSWLNDYVFNPASMALRDWGTASIVGATWITFLLSGLWHGTGWTFVVWGSLHAAGLTAFALSKSIRKTWKKRWGTSWWLQPLVVLVTFHWVCLGYLFFHAPSIGIALHHLGALFSGPWNPLEVFFSRQVFAWSLVGTLFLHVGSFRAGSVFWIFDRSLWFRVPVYIVLGYLLFRCYAPAVRYIYVQF